MSDPLVSVVTPTYNRRAFLPGLIACYCHQTYPNLEWIVLDDGRDSVEDVFAAAALPTVRYVRVHEKMRIGAKRNELNRLARGEIIVAMDDDDYYPPDRVASVVAAFKDHPTIDLAGCSAMLMYARHAVYQMPSLGPCHATNGTMAWRASYAATHRYDEHCTHAEEGSFLDQYKWPMIQLLPHETILVICHNDNTVDRTAFLDRPMRGPTIQRTSLRLEDIIQEPVLQAFYRGEVDVTPRVLEYAHHQSYHATRTDANTSPPLGSRSTRD